MHRHLVSLRASGLLLLILAAPAFAGLADFCGTPAERSDGYFTPLPGDKHIPCFTIQFADLAGTLPPDSLDSLLWGSSTGVSGYFNWVSYGRVSVTGEVIGTPTNRWFTVDPISNYPDDSAGWTHFRTDALGAVDDSVDFAVLDEDHDGHIVCVTLIAAGIKTFRSNWWRYMSYHTDDNVTVDHVIMADEYYPEKATSLCFVYDQQVSCVNGHPRVTWRLPQMPCTTTRLERNACGGDWVVIDEDAHSPYDDMTEFDPGQVKYRITVEAEYEMPQETGCITVPCP